MSIKLSNPVYHALQTGDRNLGTEEGNVHFFDSDISPFAGFDDKYKNGFDDLYNFFPPGRWILYASPLHIARPKGWRLLQKVKGVQMIYSKPHSNFLLPFEPVKLNSSHVDEMLQLTEFTRPGPFGKRTIEFGNYFGVFEKDKLVAMTGQRLHVDDFTEVSAVCTHPGYIGKGYASVLIKHQLNLISQQRKTPFLHVRRDNTRAIDLYQYLGFEIERPMNFYFMSRVNKRNNKR